MWCVLQVKTGEEMAVKTKLEEFGFIGIVPRENRLQRKGGGWTKKEYPLFPSYVFTELNYTAENYYKIKDLPAVIQFLGGGFHPDTLSFLEVEWIKILGNNGMPIEPTKMRLNSEGKLEAVDGVLLAFLNRIKTVDRHRKKAVFEITLCGGLKEVTLSVDIENTA